MAQSSDEEHCWLYKKAELRYQEVYVILGVELPVSFVSGSREGIPHSDSSYLYLGVGENTGIQVNDTNISVLQDRIRRLLSAVNGSTIERCEVNHFLVNEKKQINK